MSSSSSRHTAPDTRTCTDMNMSLLEELLSDAMSHTVNETRAKKETEPKSPKKKSTLLPSSHRSPHEKVDSATTTAADAVTTVRRHHGGRA